VCCYCYTTCTPKSEEGRRLGVISGYHICWHVFLLLLLLPNSQTILWFYLFPPDCGRRCNELCMFGIRKTQNLTICRMEGGRVSINGSARGRVNRIR
jgi:hypothetical protein